MWFVVAGFYIGRFWAHFALLKLQPKTLLLKFCILMSIEAILRRCAA